MIDVLYTTLGERFSQRQYGFHLSRLPHGESRRISRYRRWQDRQRTLLGRLLLVKGLESLSASSASPGFNQIMELISIIDSTGLKKPAIAAPYDFSISHSGEYVVCAISEDTPVGIDIEVVTDANPEDFKSHLSKGEWEKLMVSPNPVQAFFRYWTMKESVIKGDGRGMSIPLADVEITDGGALLYGAGWSVTEIPLDGAHVCHLAFRNPVTGIRVTKVDFHTITPP